MNIKTHYKPLEVKAFQYQGQPRAAWPEWLRNFQTKSEFGQQPVGIGATGEILIPGSGGMQSAHAGDWIVLDDDKLTVFRTAKFDRLFQVAAELETQKVETSGE